jgi:ABC-2 type transport system permease protein
MTTIDTPADSIPGLWTIGQRRIGFEVKALVRDRRAFVFTVLFPLILLLIFGSVFSGEVQNGVSFAQYFVAGMIASGVFYTSFQNLAISIPTEREDGTLKRLRGTPMPSGSYFLGKTGLVLVSYLLQVTMLLVVGVAFFHITLPATAFQWFTLVWVSLLGLACCTLLGLAFSVVPKNGRGASAVVSPIVLVLQFTSGVFFQFDQLPTWMQNLASIFPLKWICQGMRSVFLPESFAATENGSWNLPVVALVLVVWTVIALVLALRYFRWSRRGED